MAFLFVIFSAQTMYILLFVANTNLARMSKGVYMEKTKTTKNNNQKVEKATNTKNKANNSNTKDCGKGCDCKTK